MAVPEFIIPWKDYQTVLSAFAAIVVALVAWSASFVAASLTSRTAHKLEDRRLTAAELEVDRRRLALMSAIRIAAFATKNEAKYRKGEQATLNRRALRMPYPDILNSGWVELGLLSYQQQLDVFLLGALIARFNAVIDDQTVVDINHEVMRDLFQDMEEKARYLEESVEHRAEQILALPAMRREAERLHEDVKLALLAPLKDLEDRLRNLQFEVQRGADDTAKPS